MCVCVCVCECVCCCVCVCVVVVVIIVMGNNFLPVLKLFLSFPLSFDILPVLTYLKSHHSQRASSETIVHVWEHRAFRQPH